MSVRAWSERARDKINVAWQGGRVKTGRRTELWVHTYLLVELNGTVHRDTRERPPPSHPGPCASSGLLEFSVFPSFFIFQLLQDT